MNQPTYTCLLCGRNKFTRKTPHWCNKNYRKHGIEWKLNTEDMSENNKAFEEAYSSFLKDLNKKEQRREEEIRSIAEGFQKECHLMVKGSLERSNKDINYQDGTNAWLFYKLAQLSYEIKELKK